MCEPVPRAGVVSAPAHEQKMILALSSSLDAPLIGDPLAEQRRRLLRLFRVTPAALAELVRDTAAQVLAERDLDTSALPASVTVERPRNPEYGDYATTMAMQVAKRIGVTPVDFAGWLSQALTTHDAISSADVAGPGFVNLRLATDAQTATVREVLRRAATFGHGDLCRGLRVKLESVSCPPAGPIHLGAARSATVGDALGRILAAQGAEVVREHSFGGPAARILRVSDFDLCIVLLGVDDHDPRLKPAAPDDPKTIEVLIGQTVNLARDGTAVMEDLVDAVGVDAARYALVRSSVDSTLEIDLDLIGRRTNDNPLFSVQYAHARLSSLLCNAATLGIRIDDPDPSLLTREREGELIRTLGDYPGVVWSAASLREPHRVARYLENLAGAYHRFYNECRVLQPGDDQAGPLMIARLQLCEATRQVLVNGLGLLGVAAPEKM